MTEAFGRDVVVIASAAGAMTIVNCPTACCCGTPESFTVIVGVEVPAVVGVPEMTPVLALMESPAGIPVALQV